MNQNGKKTTFPPPDLSFDTSIDLSFDRNEPPLRRQTPGEALGIGHRHRLVTKATRRRTYDLRFIPNAISLIGALPVPGETIHAVMGGDFQAWDLIPAIQQMLDCPITELTITTLGFNHSNNGQLCDMIAARLVRRVSIVASEYFAGADPDVFHAAEQRLHERGQRLIARRVHCKIILIEPVGKSDRYVIESSANLRSCNNLEQFALTNDASLYEFHRKWIETLFATP